MRTVLRPATIRSGTPTLEREHEVELARQLIAGKPEAFDRFVEHFRAKIFHYSWLMCRNREDAEEVAQETLLKVFENFDQLREPERVRPWVFRIAKNACLMKRRKSVFAPSQELSLDDFLPADGPRGRPSSSFRSPIGLDCRTISCCNRK